MSPEADLPALALVEFTWLTRGCAPDLVDRATERRESAAGRSQRVRQDAG